MLELQKQGAEIKLSRLQKHLQKQVQAGGGKRLSVHFCIKMVQKSLQNHRFIRIKVENGTDADEFADTIAETRLQKGFAEKWHRCRNQMQKPFADIRAEITVE